MTLLYPAWATISSVLRVLVTGIFDLLGWFANFARAISSSARGEEVSGEGPVGSAHPSAFSGHGAVASTMAPGRIELPNPVKLLQHLASNLQSRRRSQGSSEELPSRKPAAEQDVEVSAVDLQASAALPLTPPATAGPPAYSAPTGPVTKEDLGRATWTLLHTLAAQYPQNPTRRQQKDVQALVSSGCILHSLEILSPAAANAQVFMMIRWTF